MAAKSVRSLTDEELLKYQEDLEKRIQITKNDLILDMEKQMLKDINKEIYTRNNYRRR